jgi:hypothetical protein
MSMNTQIRTKFRLPAEGLARVAVLVMGFPAWMGKRAV